jgi:hypothetical protein
MKKDAQNIELQRTDRNVRTGLANNLRDEEIDRVRC